MKTLLLLLLSLNIYAFALSSGELSFYLLKDGRPLANQEVILFKKSTVTTVDAQSGHFDKHAEFSTDEDGYLYSVLPTGVYQLQLVSKDKGKVQAFIRKNFVIKKDRESQIIVSLKSDNTLAFEDDEAPKTSQVNLQTKLKATQKMGYIQLILSSAQNQELISGARVFVKGLSVDLVSDKDGNVFIQAPLGEQVISIIDSDFSAQTIKVNIVADATKTKLVKLTPASMELEEFIVLAPHIEGSIAASIAEVKNSDAVGDVLGSEQFGKRGDSTVASALKRVSGITIVGGKYVYVRGLGDRYSTVMLNNLHIPSPEPTKRVVPLNIFSTSVVENITIQKSYTGDIPASFGGGTVLIKSKEIPSDDDSYIKLSLGILANSYTGSKGITNSNNATPLPSAVLENGNNTNGTAITESVRRYRTLNKQQSTLPPGTKLELSGGKSYELSDDLTIGTSGTLYYTNKSIANNISYNKYFYDINSKGIIHDSNTLSKSTTLSTAFTGMLNFGVNYLQNNKIKYTFFTTNSTMDRTRVSSINYIGATDDREKTYYRYVKKSITSHQLSGTNEIKFSNTNGNYLDNLIIDWAAESSRATRDEPGTVEINYLHETSGLNWSRANWYYSFLLDDTVTNYRADFTLPFMLNENKNYTKAGVFIYNKTRQFDSRRFEMRSTNFSDMSANMDTIYNTYASSLQFSASYRDTDSYIASQNVTAFYLKQLFSLTHNFDIIASLRQESSTQQLVDAAATYAPLQTSDLFPSLGFTYRFDNDDMQLRFAYAKTISRPDFREFSKTRYKDPVTENIVFGNPDLKATYIQHVDLKYEWYLSNDEIFSAALFAKKFTNPIEKVIKLDNSQDNIFQETYQNADAASSYGVEVDYRKYFGFINKKLEHLLFATNVALINSSITLNSDPNNDFTSRLTSKKRAMQGQSPYVANLTLGYDDSTLGNSALFLFNQIGARIVSLGTDGNKDTYQQPFAKLDFATKFNISPKLRNDLFGYVLKFRMQNILNSALAFQQGERTTSITKPGRYYSLKLEMNY